MKNKKAAMELSVTAIVVLILAIVMLGLGLGFIRGMFGKVSTQVEQQIATEAEPPIPTAINPITFSRESVITHAGDKEVIKVSTFNPTNESWDGVVPTIDCSTSGLTISEQSANTKDVEQGKFVTFNLLLTIPTSGPNTYLCEMEIDGNDDDVADYQKDLTIKIIQ